MADPSGYRRGFLESFYSRSQVQPGRYQRGFLESLGLTHERYIGRAHGHAPLLMVIQTKICLSPDPLILVPRFSLEGLGG